MTVSVDRLQDIGQLVAIAVLLITFFQTNIFQVRRVLRAHVKYIYTPTRSTENCGGREDQGFGRFIIIPIDFSGRFHSAAVQRVSVDHHHRRLLFPAHHIRTGVDSDQPIQRPSVLLLARRSLRIFRSPQVR